MKLQPKVVWEEGMHLAPHHFQAQARYLENSLHFATAGLWRYCYGFADYQLDNDALRNGIISLVSARGIFQDGLAFDIPDSDLPPATINITEKFSPTADKLQVCLAIPAWSADRQNCIADGKEEDSIRYMGIAHSLCDETTGGDDRRVVLGQKNLKLIVEGEANEELLTLPLARIARDGSGHFVFDKQFIPPLLRFAASDSLSGLLKRLVEILESKSLTVSGDRHRSSGRFQAGMSERDVSQFWFLHAVNSSLSPLRHLLLSKHVHPEELFNEMSRLAGALCTFDVETHPASLPKYDHREPGASFLRIDSEIRRLLDVFLPSQAVVIPLRASERYFFTGEVKDERCLGRSRWLLGIHSPIGEADLILKVPQLLKVCSAAFVSKLVERALPGLVLTHMQVPPSAISANVDSQYFTISRNGPCWEHILQTKKVGLYVPGDFPAPELELIAILEG
jgi:type VI secretion system protein ImpJ